MATPTKAGNAPVEAAALPSADAHSLRETIQAMDAAAGHAFERIDALAQLILLALESPDAYQCPDLIAHALKTISEIAEETGDECRHSAELVGCSWVHKAAVQRTDARREASQKAIRRTEGGQA